MYFDVLKFSESHHYGALSGRNLDEMIANSRELAGQSDKKKSAGFCPLEKGRTQSYYALALAVECGFSGLAPGVYSDEHQIFR